MKYLCALFTTFFIFHFSYAQNSANLDARITEDRVISIDSPPEYPGGMDAFSDYISKNLKYPEIARLLKVNGKLLISFIIEKDGKVTNVIPKNRIGAGCETEAVRLFETSPAWKPGIQNGREVRVIWYVPISFALNSGEVYFKNLKSSNYGFVFNIKNLLYTIDEAEAILGKSFMSDRIEIAEPFFNYNKVEKFNIRDKKEVYLLKFKNY